MHGVLVPMRQGARDLKGLSDRARDFAAQGGANRLDFTFPQADRLAKVRLHNFAPSR